MSEALVQGKVGDVPFGKLVPHTDNIRDRYEGIDELASSIKHSGLHTPLKVRAEEDGTFTILAGHRRHMALTTLGVADDQPIPALVTTENGQTDQVTMLVENIFRDDVDELEEAKAIRSLVEVYGLTQAKVADATGLSRSVISDRVKLSKLPPVLHPSVRSGTIRLVEAMEIASDWHLLDDVMAEELYTVIESDTDDEGVVTYNTVRTIINTLTAIKRESVVIKGIGEVEKSGREYFRSEKDVEAPEGKRLKWTQLKDSIDDLPKKTRKVIVSAGGDGKPRFRPVEFEDAETEPRPGSDAQVKQTQAANRQFKIDQMNFWQEILSGRVAKKDVHQSLVDALARNARFGERVYKHACTMLGVEKDDVPIDKYSQTPDWRTGWETQLAASESKALLALVASNFLNNDSSTYRAPGSEEFQNFWG